jgi:hypothetical protein
MSSVPTYSAIYNNGVAAKLGDPILIMTVDGSIIHGTVIAILANNKVRLDSHSIPLNAANAIVTTAAHAASTTNLQKP